MTVRDGTEKISRFSLQTAEPPEWKWAPKPCWSHISIQNVSRNLHSAAGYSKKFIKLDMDKRTRSHSAKLKKSRCNTELRRHFFSERMVNRWNSLKQATVEAAEVNSFKRLLDGERLTRIDLFIDWHQLVSGHLVSYWWPNRWIAGEYKKLSYRREAVRCLMLLSIFVSRWRLL